MLRSAKEIRGYSIQAKDGRIGEVKDYYFDDDHWIVRYLVVDTGGFFGGREVLLTPAVLGQPDWSSGTLPVNLTKQQVKDSPDVDLKQPVSRQNEIDLHEYYDWSPYWSPTVYGGVPVRPMPISMTGLPAYDPAAESAPVTTQTAVMTRKASRLRSMDEVEGYHIQAADGEIGHVEEFVIDDESWSVMYLVVDTRNWLPGRKVLVALSWIDQIDWREEKVHVALHKETIRNSPEYDPNKPVNRQYETILYDYYGRPTYWDGTD